MATVTISWAANPASDNVTAYEVWGANGTGTAFGSCTKLATVLGLTWTDTGLPNNQARTYYIVAVNAVGSSSPDGPINITTASASSTYVQNLGSAPSLQEGTHAARPAAGNANAIYIEIDTGSIFRDTGSAWSAIGGSTGTVTTTGSPTSGNLAVFSGATSITDGNLSGDVTTSGSLVVTIAAGAVSLAKMANLAANSILGNNTGSAATPMALTGAQVTAMLDVFSSTLQGVVPASGGGTSNFLRADGTWGEPAGHSWIPLVGGAEPADFITDGAGHLILVGA